ncbi:MAG: flagellar biosynthesis anti-sigma factor FlgM [Nitrosomonadales bacterium]|nr:flagellar biosynthesis anti-sigma factor FlgM [Nitrosomonadales bacterium]
MKIDKPGKQLPTYPIGEAAARATGRKSKPGTPTAPQQPGSTSVSLGSTAAQLQSMESSMANIPVADAAKVAEIKQAISNGRFKVNPEVVADRLLETVRDLIDNRA